MAEFRHHQIFEIFVKVGQPYVSMKIPQQDSLTIWIRNDTVVDSHKDLN
jgi:hypothetical protein